MPNNAEILNLIRLGKSIGNATNAGLLAAEIFGLFDQSVQDKIIAMRAAREEAIIKTNADWNAE